jgi:hypothetical protein
MAVPTSQTAKMGYIGFAKIFGLPIRITSSNLGLKQDIVPTDMIDGSSDRTIYRQSVIAAEGDMTFPVIMDDQLAFLNTIWKFAVERNRSKDSNKNGELTNSGDITVKYTQSRAYLFKNSKIHGLTLNMTQQEIVTGTLSLWGIKRTAFTDNNPGNYISPACVATWADSRVFGYKDQSRKSDPKDQNATFQTQAVRSFAMTISNNLERNYTFNKGVGLVPTNITTGQRDVTGTLEFQGWSPLEDLAESHSSRPYSDEIIEFRIYPRNSSANAFIRKLYGIVYQLQDISMSMGLISSVAAWRAYGIRKTDNQPGVGNIPAYKALDVENI